MKASVMGIEFVMCDCYIDQNHYIGDDKIGCKCCKMATKSSKIKGLDLDICDVCLEIWKKDPERISFPNDIGSRLK